LLNKNRIAVTVPKSPAELCRELMRTVLATR
jgi:hypothetical protein